MIKNFFLYLIIFSIILNINSKGLNVIGDPLYIDGLGRLPIAIMDCLSKDVNINFIKTVEGLINLEGIPNAVIEIIHNNDKVIGDVSILYSAPSYEGCEPYKKIPDSKIKLAYSMLESSRIPESWVYLFNKHFDAIIVPDEFLVKVYQESGVEKPIFVLPCILYLEDFLKQPLKKTKNNIFKFGISAAFGVEKNHIIVLEAFAKEFANNPFVSLDIHGKWGNEGLIDLKERIKSLSLSNVNLIEKKFSKEEYLNFFKSLDCYVLLSRGEGFSITPREALALGIPCVLSYHTAHKTICDSVDCTLKVKAETKTPIYYKAFNSDCGYQLTCNIEDAQKELREVYLNYDFYLKKNHLAREWTKQYLIKNIKEKYLNLIEPKKIIFGSNNIVSDESLTTNSIELYSKYLKLSNQ